MVAYLRTWLSSHGGRGSVWVKLAGEASSGAEYTLSEVDHVGVVLSSPASNGVGTAYPWGSIAWILPDQR